MNLDSVMWFASCTKLFTTIAALQCVERELLDLDGDITEILPEFKGVQILTGFDGQGLLRSKVGCVEGGYDVDGRGHAGFVE